MEAIRIDDLRFTYRGTKLPVLNGINLDVKRGEFVVIAGQTGAGKSTLCFTLNSIVPLYKPGRVSGNIEIFGRSIRGNRRVADMAQIVGVISQDFESQLCATDVELEVAFGQESLGFDQDQISSNIPGILSQVGLAGFEDRDTSALSGGEKQRLAIASMLALDPRILVMDAPFTDLDHAGKNAVFTAVNQRRKNGLTLILVESDAAQMLNADRIVIINEGKVAKQGTPEEVLSNIKFLESNGIRFPQVAVPFFNEGEDSPPLTSEEAYESFQSRGWKIDREKYASLVYKEKHRRQRGTPIIEVNNLLYAYPERRVLEGINFKIYKGEFLAIIGSNGSGKTTLAKHFNGLLKPPKGEVVFLGEDTQVRSVAELSQWVGYLSQDIDQQIVAPTVYEEVAFGPINIGVPEDEIGSRIAEVLKLVALSGYENRSPFSLTKSERRRLALASVLALGPMILVCDEPTAGLDFNGQKMIMELLTRLNQAGHTIIIITQTMWVVAEYAHRALILHEGKIIADDTVRNIFAQEELLARASLKSPEIVQLSHRLGVTALSAKEFDFCLKKQ
ncbi:MAG: energy-coupling factor transporter ATPase [bacterium]|nr:energy-coupling factor transporter ATPase [bacterium]